MLEYILAGGVMAAALTLLFTRRGLVSTIARSAAANAVPVGYCLAMAFFLYLYDQRFMVPFSGYSRPYQLFLRLNYALPFTSFYILYTSDPGHVSKLNHPRLVAKFAYDKVLYMPHAECRTCLLAKPARSRHCSVCNRCVAMQDHHCIWINNCIGLYNYRYFLLFLLVNLYIFAYGFICIYLPMRNSFADAWQQPGVFGKFAALINMGEAQKTATCLLLLCTVLCPLVFAFTCFHLWYVYAGVTTTESDKWADIIDLIPEKMLYTYSGTSILLLRKFNGQFNRRLSADEQAFIEASGAQLQLVTDKTQIPNIYDHGFFKNLHLLLLPDETNIM